MKYIFQFGIIMFFVLVGEILAALIPLPIAGSIYGLLLLFLCLCTGLIKLSWVEDVADWLHGIMSLFFIAPAVAIIDTWADISDVWWILLLLLVTAYLITMISTGLTAQAMLPKSNDKSTSRRTIKAKGARK